MRITILQRKTWRRQLCLLLSLFLLSGITACGIPGRSAGAPAGERAAQRGEAPAAGSSSESSVTGSSAAPEDRKAAAEEQAAKEAASEAAAADAEIPEAPYYRDDGGVSMDVFAMDTYMTLLAYGTEKGGQAQAEEAVRAAAAEIHSLDALLSTGDADSEISKLNAAGGGEVSAVVEELILRSQELRKETDGLFEIAIYPVMKLWGFPSQEYRVPEKAELDAARKLADASAITITDSPAPAPKEKEQETGPAEGETAAAASASASAAANAVSAETAGGDTSSAVRKAAEAGAEGVGADPAETGKGNANSPDTAAAAASAEADAEESGGRTAVFGIPGMEIDLGGIAKGYTSSRVMEIFREHGIEHGLVSLGGNVQALGTKENGKPWRVAIQNPEDELKYLGVLDIADKCVITSGGYERFFEQDGRRYHHIIDPRTGYPAESGLLSATIISDDGALADGLSTALFIMGKDKAEEYWRAHPWTFDYILEDTDGTLYVTAGAADLFTTDCRTVLIQ